MTETTSWAALPLRLTIGPMFLAHGAQKLFGAFGGSGLQVFADSLAGLGLSPGLPWAVLAGGAEFFGGLCILLGLCTRWAVWPPIAVMLVAIFKVHWGHGFFAQQGGFEYPLVVLGGLLTLLAVGPGPCSVDARCCGGLSACRTEPKASGT